MEWPQSRVREFWQAHPLKLGERVLPEPALYPHLWDEGCRVPFAYILEILQAVEPFLLFIKTSPPLFFQALIQNLQYGSFFSPKYLLYLLHPHLESFFLGKDPRYEILKAFPLILEKAFPGMGFRIHREEVQGDWRQVWTSLRLPIPVADCRELDIEKWAEMGLRHMPKLLDMPAFEHMEVLSSPFQFELEKAASKAGSVTMKAFSDLYDEWGYKGVLKKHDAIQVALALRKFRSPSWGRVTLNKGVAYAAPLTLIRFRFRRNLPKPDNFLNPFISAAVESRDNYLAEAEKKHMELLETLTGILDVHFDPAAQRISVNGRVVAKNLPALILAKIVARSAAEERTEFEFRDFALDPELKLNPLNPNFVLRLNRLSATLRKKCPEMEIKATRRGAFRFICTKGFRFRKTEV